MSKYINDHSLSIGYNNSGQEFFDLLKQYDQYIHSYFFSLTKAMDGSPYNINEVINLLNECNTYDIPANLLLNDIDSQNNWDKIIPMIKDLVNLKDLTIMNIDDIEEIKYKYPDLNIHLSVRYFDWNANISVDELIFDQIDKCKEYIDTINISGDKSFNDHQLINIIHSFGIKVKMIVNEGCIINRHNNYNGIQKYKQFRCDIGKCSRVCDKIINDNPWMLLSRINLYKEMLQYYDIDILKLATRPIPTDKIEGMIEYWTSDDNTKMIFDKILVDNNYDLYLKYCKEKSYCSGYCISCMKCKQFYEELIK